MGDDALGDALEELLGRPPTSPRLAALRLGLASSAEIRASTSGEVVRSQTLAWETLEPCEGGLFCDRLFGPLAPSGSDRAARARALDSPFLAARDDEVVAPRPRLETFARISLARELDHPLFSDRRWRPRLAAAGLERWTLDVLPVLPPDLRAIVAIEHPDGERFAMSDLNELYRVVIHANARLVRLRELRAPKTIVDVEHARLDEAVAQLIDNAGTPEPRLGPAGRPLVGLFAMIASPARPAWATLAELDGMVARGVVRAVRAPLAKRSLALVSHLRALGITIRIAEPCPTSPATVH
jgi:DNA-directed RNA polymerase beta' subunit